MSYLGKEKIWSVIKAISKETYFSFSFIPPKIIYLVANIECSLYVGWKQFVMCTIILYFRDTITVYNF